MKHCAFLSMDATELAEFFVYDELLRTPLLQKGWQVSDVPWRDQDTDWQQYDAVVVRSTWDYQQDPEAFFDCLTRIEAAGVPLFNSLNTMRWNLDKHYLADLEQKGVDIVPTRWMTGFDRGRVEKAFDDLHAATLVIKPTVSANADDTHRLTRENLPAHAAQFESLFAGRDVIVQPFVHAVVEEGEYSLFYFGGGFSHAICKRPASGDFRVQEEHGGQLFTYRPEEALFSAAEKVMQALPDPCLYARVDLVRYQQRWCLMEVELIEPSLYFNMDDDSPERFAAAFIRAVERDIRA